MRSRWINDLDQFMGGEGSRNAVTEAGLRIPAGSRTLGPAYGMRLLRNGGAVRRRASGTCVACGLDLVECCPDGRRAVPLAAAVHVLDAAGPHDTVFARANRCGRSGVGAHVPGPVPRPVTLRDGGHLLRRQHDALQFRERMQSTLEVNRLFAHVTAVGALLLALRQRRELSRGRFHRKHHGLGPRPLKRASEAG